MKIKLLNEGSYFQNTNYQKYVVPSTGLTITLFEHDGPIISGDILLKTLTTDNDGLPHTLEHLIFMGSSGYPKGFIDVAANHCLSSGTNAWTDQDSTAYTVSCAGKEGFLTFLPVFLDHILFPVLTDEVFTTEVYHINGEGQDGGVVYCEMQTYENTMDMIAEREFSKTIFGKGSAYSVETGGMLSDLRTSCNVEKCRAFHAQTYHADNMNIIIRGKMSIDEIAAAILPVHNKILASNGEDMTCGIPKSPVENDCSIETGTFENTDVSTVFFPSSDDKDPGTILFGFRGPSIDDPLAILAEDIMLEYLINTPASPLTKDLVHVSEPYCASLSYHRYPYCDTIVQMKLNETDPLKHDTAKEAITNILECELKSGLNMDRITSIVENKLMCTKLNIENHDLEILVSYAYADHLYGDKFPNLLDIYAKTDLYLEKLSTSDAKCWTGILNRLVQSVCACIAAQPSLDYLQKLESEEEERIEKRITEFGEEKLAVLGRKLAKAEESNNVEISPDLVHALPKPNMAKLNVYDRNTLYKFGDDTVHSVYLHVAKSSFYRFYFVIDTDKLSVSEKLLVPLITEAFCNFPVKDHENEFMTGDEVATKCEKLFLHHDVSLGLFGEQICLDFTFKEDNLDKCIAFLQCLLFCQVVDKDRVSEYLMNLKSSVKADKRCGYESIQSLYYQHLFPSSVTAKTGLFCQEYFLENASLDDTCSKLQSILNEFFNSDCCLHIMSNVEYLQKIDVDQLAESFKLNVSRINYFVARKSFLRSDLDDLKSSDIVVKVPGEETSYMASVIPVSSFPHDITDMKMKVFQSWFGQLDGVIGKEIRGKGLAYHFYVENTPSDGTLSVQFQQSTDVMAAFHAVKEVIDGITVETGGDNVIDQHQVDLAKRAVFSSLIKKIRSPHQMILWDMLFIHRKTARKSLIEISAMLDSISCDDIIELCKEFHSKLFAKGEAVKIITIPQNKDI